MHRFLPTHVIRGCIIALALLGGAGEVGAQTERNELGKRLRRFELAWEHATEADRRAATPFMQEAVNSFFSLRLTRAAELLDSAWREVTQEDVPEWWLAAAPWRIVLPRLVLDKSATTLQTQLKALYPSASELPADLKVTWQIQTWNGEQHYRWPEQAWPGETAVNLEWPADFPALGDFRLTAELHSQGKVFALLPQSISRISDWPARRTALATRADARPAEWPMWLQATVSEYSAWFESLADGQLLETDYPVAQLLTLAEQWTTSPDTAARGVQSAAAEHDVWLTLKQGRSKCSIRFRLPPQSAVPPPVTLVLYHGAGGSENMFFETYGAGRAVALGLARNWLVVAPRQELMGSSWDCQQMLDELHTILGWEKTSVLLLGHSMGAGQVIRQVTRDPDLASAVAAIGGGSRIGDAAKVAQVPWFVAAGELDFGKRGASALAASLRGAKAPQMKYQEYAGIEHMVIVQAALDDVFNFFDARRSARQ